jgi:hypothetical protein
VSRRVNAIARWLICLLLIVATEQGCVGWMACKVPTTGALETTQASEDLHRLREARVDVDCYSDPERSELLLSALRDSGMFNGVGRYGPGVLPDFVARIVTDRPRSEVLPILPAITLGIVPQWFTVQDGFEFEIVHASTQVGVVVDGRFDDHVIYGWVALLFLPFDGYVTPFPEPEATCEYAAFVRHRIAPHVAELACLLRKRDEQEVR